MRFVVLLMAVLPLTTGCQKKQTPDTEMQTAAEKALESTTAEKAPDFSLPDLNGVSVSLSSFQGKGVVLDFWATWCPPCVKEIPHFVELYDAYKDKGLVILGVSLDDTKEDITRFLEKQKIPYPILYADKLTLSEVANKFGGVQFLPTTFFISPDGRIVKRLEGYHAKTDLEQLVTRILPSG